jgi:hypothetical protein
VQARSGHKLHCRNAFSGGACEVRRPPTGSHCVMAPLAKSLLSHAAALHSQRAQLIFRVWKMYTLGTWSRDWCEIMYPSGTFFTQGKLAVTWGPCKWRRHYRSGHAPVMRSTPRTLVRRPGFRCWALLGRQLTGWPAECRRVTVLTSWELCSFALRHQLGSLAFCVRLLLPV